MIIEINNKVDSLEKLLEELTQNNDYSYKIRRDMWSDDFISHKKCIVVRKTATCGAKIRFLEPNVLEILAIRPSSWLSTQGIIGSIIDLVVEKQQEEVVMNTVNDIKNINRRIINT